MPVMCWDLNSVEQNYNGLAGLLAQHSLLRACRSTNVPVTKVSTKWSNSQKFQAAHVRITPCAKSDVDEDKVISWSIVAISFKVGGLLVQFYYNWSGFNLIHLHEGKALALVNLFLGL